MDRSSVTGPDSPFAVTFFKTSAATTKTQGDWSLTTLARHIAATTASAKAKLPWLKLATFGASRTSKASLRHDANLQAITGIEADFDAEDLAFDEAVERLTSTGLLGLIYTSPSHTEERPRWRILCPLSEPMPPLARDRLMGRLNGLFHGIFSSESWTLSQAYYFGSVASNPHHRVEVVDGTPIDGHDDLDTTWQGKPNTLPSQSRGDACLRIGKLDDAALLAQIAQGDSYHAAGVRLLGSWARTGVAFMDARRRLLEAMQAVPEDRRDTRWQARHADVDRCLEDIYGRDAAKRDSRAEADSPSSNAANDAGATSEVEHEERPSAVTDEGLALRFGDIHANTLRYVAAWGRWMQWSGAAWKADGTLHVFDLSRTVCRRASVACTEPRVAAAVASAKTVSAVERLAKADRRHAATVEQWDSDAWLLNTPGGTVDLRTGRMRRHRAEDCLTKVTAVAPGGDCPLWLSFLQRVTNGDADLEAYLQRVFGYCLTGSIREHALFFAYGTGANGKGVFINTLSGILGDYAAIATMETFTASTTDRHPTDLAMLRGARVVAAQETEEGRRWAEARIKALTGGDPITARFMRQDFFTYTPTFKLLVAGNHRPALRGVDEAIRRRMNLIPFAVQIPPEERDPNLPERLVPEWPGILKWAIAGCLEWQRVGLSPPRAVTEATAEYLAAEDAPANWLAERCITRPALHTSSSLLFSSWKLWAEAAGELAGSQKALTQNLLARGFNQKRLTDGRAGFLGIGLRAPSIRDGDSNPAV